MSRNPKQDMYSPSLKEYLELSKKSNVIPVFKQISADLDTPVSAFMKLKNDDYSFLLESVEGQEQIARYSFLGSMPSLVLTSRGRTITISKAHEKKSETYETRTDPLDEIKRIMRNFRPAVVKGLPRFYGGFVGYLSYDMVRFFEYIPDKNGDDLGVPESMFMLTDSILIFDHVNHVIKIVCNVIFSSDSLSLQEKIRLYERAVRKIDDIEKDFNAPYKRTGIARAQHSRFAKVTSNLKPSAFERIVRKAQDYIIQGDIIQVVLAQRFCMTTNKGFLDIYRNLRSINPSPYMFLLKFGERALIGASPEMLVRCEEGIVQTRPIAGTRPRGKTEEDDAGLAEELLHDAKEKAEHVMLVDLGRNDLGRVCKPGSVNVHQFMDVERYSHVMHLVSEVRGELDPRYDIYDVMRACFPAGTVSGSPKIRAMEIIDELENTRRGPYAGAVGYFSFSHNMDTCITLRTMVVKKHTAYIYAGAGIVLDSVPNKEYQESVNKAKALMEAIQQ